MTGLRCLKPPLGPTTHPLIFFFFKLNKLGMRHVTSHFNDTQYCLLLAPPNQTSQEVTHPSTTLAEAYLIAEF
jgi:hypothetical protein